MEKIKIVFVGTGFMGQLAHLSHYAIINALILPAPPIQSPGGIVIRIYCMAPNSPDLYPQKPRYLVLIWKQQSCLTALSTTISIRLTPCGSSSVSPIM